MGQIRKRGDVWWIRYYRNGRRFEESARSEKRQAAVDLLKIREGDVAKGIPVSSKVGQLRFEDAGKALVADYQVNKKRSIGHVKRNLKKLGAWFGGRRMAELRTSDVIVYTANRQTQGAMNSTINRELASLKRMFTLAVRGGELMARPHIPMLREDNTRKGFFERAQFEAVRSHLPSALQAVATFAYYTGWRTKAEILPLEWRHVDRAAGVVRLEPGTTKNREGRQFKYAELDELRSVIEGLWSVHEALEQRGLICPYVFFVRVLQKKLEARRVRNFRKAWIAACKLAGCPARIPHDFRRTAVRNLVRAGVSDTIAMKMTGHKTGSVFDRYDITSEEDLAEASRRLQTLTGTITGTIWTSDTDAIKTRLAKVVRTKRLVGGPPGDRTRDTVIKSDYRPKFREMRRTSVHRLSP
jgi:integrase